MIECVSRASMLVVVAAGSALVFSTGLDGGKVPTIYGTLFAEWYLAGRFGLCPALAGYRLVDVVAGMFLNVCTIGEATGGPDTLVAPDKPEAD